MNTRGVVFIYIYNKIIKMKFFNIPTPNVYKSYIINYDIQRSDLGLGDYTISSSIKKQITRKVRAKKTYKK